MPASIQELAKRARVSVATVSRVFNNRPYVKKEVRERILKLAREINYMPRFTARKDVVAVVVDGLAGISLGGYEAAMIAAMTRQLSLHDLHFQIIPASELEFAREKFIQGAVAIVTSEQSIARVQQVSGFPVVSTHIIKGIPTVCSDHRQGAFIATQHLIARNHKRIGLIVHSLESDDPGSSSPLRVAGYCDALKKAKIPYDRVLVQPTDKQSAFEAAAKILHAKPTAMIVCGEGMSAPISYTLHLLGASIPSQVSLITYEQPGVSQYHLPPHTTIEQDFDGVAQAAVEQLMRVIEGTGSTQSGPVMIANRLIERESVETI